MEVLRERCSSSAVTALTSCTEHLVFDDQQVCVEGIPVILAGMVLAPQVEQHLTKD